MELSQLKCIVLLLTTYPQLDISFGFPAETTNSKHAAFIYVVNNSNLESWLKKQGPDAFLTRGGRSVLYLHRARRENVRGRALESGEVEGVLDTEPTPLLPLNGEKKFNETGCMPWWDAAAIVDSALKPKHKTTYLEPVTCRIDEGLECVPTGDKDFYCRCMLIYGPKAVYTNYTDEQGKTKWHCFTPAGLGFASECYAKSWNSFGYPLPFGDPPGRNVQQAAETDAFNQEDGSQIIIDYIRWNSVVPKCVPKAECREMGTYRGQRCQCKQGHKLLKPEGRCGGGEYTNEGGLFSFL